MNPLRILLRSATKATLFEAIPVERLRALILEQTDGRLDLLLSEPDPETRVGPNGEQEWDEPESKPTQEILSEAIHAATRNARATPRPRAPKKPTGEPTATVPPSVEDQLNAVLRALPGVAVSVLEILRRIPEKRASELGISATNLVHLLATLKDRGLADNATAGEDRWYYTAAGIEAANELPDDEEEAPADATASEPLFATESDVLGAMLESKPQTIAQIASYLQLGVARVAPTIDALVKAGKVEQAKAKGRYPQFQKVAA